QQLFKAAPATDGSTLSCNFCHNNAGANDAAGGGRNFATGAAFAPNAPTCSQPSVPIEGDGGFGGTPELIRNASTFCANPASFDVMFRGDLGFNSQSVIEAADTAPFFHNNIAQTVEETVAFYTSDTFRNSGSGNGRAFDLSNEQINKIAAFMRSLNVLENIRSSNGYDQQARLQIDPRRRDTIGLGIKETSDAIAVLTGGPLPIYAGTDVLKLLTRARALQQQARQSLRPQPLLNSATALKNQARKLIVN
ncbi:MAG TPA: hypothetical protein VES39_05810, partial [Rhodospirillales bacterium]|nr:hypothetical protein [Rhodospirillales bacterium]